MHKVLAGPLKESGVDIVTKESERNVLALILFFEVRTSMLPLPGSTQCNGINLAIIHKEQSIL